MANDVVITACGVSKKYRLGGVKAATRNLRETITDLLTKPFRWRSKLYGSARPGFLDASANSTFWALRDVSFTVNRGDVIGIVGRNGAGKSTLLKILARVTEPNEGEIEIRGRIGSLLEVGTGFQAELTGRENIFLNGAILGMTKKEVRKRFDGIVTFAEVERFLDTPVKHYSSGMYMRLAFAVAAHLDTDILIVDEVLAVGDARFQKKCIGRMRDMAHGSRTVLFVSHNMEAVRRLCNQGMWLDAGQVQATGPIQEVVDKYLLANMQKGAEVVFDPAHVFPNGMGARLHKLRVLNDQGRSATHFSTAGPVRIEIDWENSDKLYKPRLGFVLQTADGIDVLCAHDALSWEEKWLLPGRRVSACNIPGGLLNEGEYVLDVGCDSPASHDFTQSRTGPIISFTVEDPMTLPNKHYGQEGFHDGRWAGILLMNIPWVRLPVWDKEIPAANPHLNRIP